MTIDNQTTENKAATRIISEAGRVNKDITVTISERSPDSIRYSHRLPATQGWTIVQKFPIDMALEPDYAKFLKRTKYKEIWFRVASSKGRTKIYVR